MVAFSHPHPTASFGDESSIMEYLSSLSDALSMEMKIIEAILSISACTIAASRLACTCCNYPTERHCPAELGLVANRLWPLGCFVAQTWILVVSPTLCRAQSLLVKGGTHQL